MKAVMLPVVIGTLAAMVLMTNAFAISPIIGYSPEGECPPRDSNVTIFLPDSENCTLYYLCSNGQAIQKECPPGTAWNTDNEVCDWEIDSHCDNQKSFVPLSAVGTCPEKDGSIPVYLPDSDRCDIYYECSGGVPIQNDCPPGEEWNAIKNTCDFPIDSGCTAGTASP